MTSISSRRPIRKAKDNRDPRQATAFRWRSLWGRKKRHFDRPSSCPFDQLESVTCTQGTIGISALSDRSEGLLICIRSQSLSIRLEEPAPAPPHNHHDEKSRPVKWPVASKRLSPPPCWNPLRKDSQSTDSPLGGNTAKP